MNAMLTAHYPGHQTRAVIQHFTSPDLPPRHPTVQELGSITVPDGAGYLTVFLFKIPDADVAAAVRAQMQRSAYLLSRVEGLTLEMHVGTSVEEGIPLFLSAVGK